MSEKRIKFVENRFSPSGGDTANLTTDDAADTVFLRGGLGYCFNHGFCRISIRRAGGIFFNFVYIKGFSFDSGDFLCVGGDFHPERLEKEFCHRSGGNARRRFASGRTPAATYIADAVFCIVGVIGVSGTEGVFQFGIVLAPLIGVADDDRKRCGSWGLPDAI